MKRNPALDYPKTDNDMVS